MNQTCHLSISTSRITTGGSPTSRREAPQPRLRTPIAPVTHRYTEIITLMAIPTLPERTSEQHQHHGTAHCRTGAFLTVSGQAR